MRHINSPAFPGGTASYTPVDADEAWLSGHANLVSWVSGQGVSFQTIGDVWDDLVNPDLSYQAGGVLPARPDVGPDNRPVIRCAGAGVANSAFMIPASYTVLATASIDAITNGSQTIVGSQNNSDPRMQLFISPSGVPTHLHAATGSKQYYGTVAPINTTFLLGCDFNSSNLVANIYYNALATRDAEVFGVAHPSVAGVGIGQMGDRGRPLTGTVTDALVFNTVLSEADRARAMRVLGRRSGIVVAGV